MSVIAKFLYEIIPGRFDDFMEMLGQAASPEFDSPVMPSSVRLFRCIVPGPDTSSIQLFIEYPDMAAYGRRTDFENNNPKWRALFSEQPDSPQRLVSVELLSEIVPSAPL
ncbi:hypothetical protein [Marinobacter sediminicola]|uniref:hypothetical protein n=1 Tax=Marinobacter sediminicola TaxID=3072994 RepID=UPI002811785E|nr:hypothetical protein [Marinobacter sp. F26243]